MNLTTLFTPSTTAVCSLDLTKMVNKLRKHRKPYQHWQVTAKIRGALGKKADEFSTNSTFVNGQRGVCPRTVYKLPKAEALNVLLSMPHPVSAQVRTAKKAYEAKTAEKIAQQTPVQVAIESIQPTPQGEPTMKLTALTLNTTGEVLTMSSLEMVSYINSTRKAGEAEVRHDHFMPKVPTVLGKAAPKFLGTAFYMVNGAKRERQIYNFPKREAMLMAMSYSYELQAQVFDAWAAAEAALVKPVQNVFALPDFSNPAAAARAWAEQFEAKALLITEIKEAQPKIAFHDAVVEDETTYALAEAAKILGFGPNKFNQKLRDEGMLMRSNVAYQHYITLGVFVLRFTGYVLDNGTVAPATTRVTSKGVTYLQKKFGKVVVA